MTQAISKKLRNFFFCKGSREIHYPGKVSKKRQLWSKTGKEHMPFEIASWKLVSVGPTLRKPVTDTIKRV